MIHQTFSDIVTTELSKGAIINNEFPGFKEDYLVLVSLIKKYKPERFFEIGTNHGSGTKIIAHAMEGRQVYSLDLPFDKTHPTLKKGEKDLVGHHCNLPFIQLRGDSMTFEYNLYPCDGYFVDGEHDYEHCFKETTEILKCKPKIIIFHDLHVIPVKEAIEDAFTYVTDYELFRVEGTRIAYALKKQL